MNLQETSHAGWDRNLRIANDHVELIVTLDVGPRIISYRRLDGQNVFKNYEGQLGGRAEGEWMIRGGHRLWIAPESEASYELDNEAVDYQVDETTGEVVIETGATGSSTIRKTLGITLSPDSPKVAVRHTATNTGEAAIEIATWGLSVMAPGGVEIIPQPPLGEHPRDLLPNRGIVLWAYTDLSDPRIHFGRDFFTLRQSEGFPPTKFGLSHRENWVAYVLGDDVFVKTIEFEEGAVYPDGGCNFETFTNDEMLEVESLGPLTRLENGESVSHTEHWYLSQIQSEAQIESEKALGNWLRPFIVKALG